MADMMDPSHLDKRTAERYMEMGLLNEKDWEKHLKGLEDVAAKSTLVKTVMGQDDEVDEGEAPEGQG